MEELAWHQDGSTFCKSIGKPFGEALNNPNELFSPNETAFEDMVGICPAAKMDLY